MRKVQQIVMFTSFALFLAALAIVYLPIDFEIAKILFAICVIGGMITGGISNHLDEKIGEEGISDEEYESLLAMIEEYRIKYEKEMEQQEN